MARAILVDEFHVTLFAPRNLREAEYDAIHQTLYRARLRAGLLRAVRDVLRRYPSLRKVRITLTR